jgi:hypothetical protein
MKSKYHFATICTTCVLLFLLVLPLHSFSQPGFTDDVNDVPVDGGLSLLIAAGVGYGAKKIRQYKKSIVS